MSQDMRRPLRPLAALRESNLCVSAGAKILRTPVLIHGALAWMTHTSFVKQVKCVKAVFGSFTIFVFLILLKVFGEAFWFWCSLV